MLNCDAKNADLTRWIRTELQAGLPIGPDVAAFMEATFGTTSLRRILETGESTECDSLLELIFYPTPDLQARFETRWGETVFSARDQAAVTAALLSDPPIALLQTPAPAQSRTQTQAAAPTETVTLPAPDFALEALVQRMNITWQPAPGLVDPLKRLPPATATAARVQLRNSRLTEDEGQVALAARFLDRFPAQAPDHGECLGYLISILSEMPPGQDHYAFLCEKKHFCFRSLCRAEDFERRRLSSSMEVLMLQGNRAAHGDITQWRAWMRLIDRINQALFGRTEFFRQA